MRKSSTNMNAALSHKRSVSRLSTFAAILLIGVISAPLVIECAVLYHAKWSAILGKSANARTPILDSIQHAWLRIYEELSLNAAYFISAFSISQQSCCPLRPQRSPSEWSFSCGHGTIPSDPSWGDELCLIAGASRYGGNDKMGW